MVKLTDFHPNLGYNKKEFQGMEDVENILNRLKLGRVWEE